MRNEIVLEKISQVIELLNEIDSMIENCPKEQQNIDYQLSDLYHLIENNELSDEASIAVVKKIHELRKIRRSLDNEFKIENTYNTHKSKLPGRENRQFLLNEIHKTIKTLGVKYKNRVLTDEDITEILTPKKKRGRPPKEKEQLDEGEN
jgi:hypothetical protein